MTTVIPYPGRHRTSGPCNPSPSSSLGHTMAWPGTAANKTTHSSHPYSGLHPLLLLSLSAQPTLEELGVSSAPCSPIHQALSP